MRLMLSIIISLGWLLLSYPHTYAQDDPSPVPGYIGKRCPITFNLHTFPALAQAESLSELTPNLRGSLHFEYVLSRAHSIYGQLSYLQTTFDYQRDSLMGEAMLRVPGIEFGARLYSLQRGSNLAPLGFHQQLGLRFVPYQVDDLDGNFSQGKSRLGNFRDLILVYGIGDQRIIHPSIIYYFNIQGGWLFNFFPTQPTQEATEVKALATSRLRNFSLLNISLGIGFILF